MVSVRLTYHQILHIVTRGVRRGFSPSPDKKNLFNILGADRTVEEHSVVSAMSCCLQLHNVANWYLGIDLSSDSDMDNSRDTFLLLGETNNR